MARMYMFKIIQRNRHCTVVKALHNAICVTNAWRKIRLGFVISPLEIIYPNCVKMLMLVGYLFDILPTYTPKGKVSERLTRTLFKTSFIEENKVRICF